MPAPPLNRDQYINDPDRVISDDALLPQSSIVHSAPASSTRSGHPIRPLEPIDDIHEEVLVASATTTVDNLDNEPWSYKQAMKSLT